jgi:hypothetical protein
LGSLCRPWLRSKDQIFEVNSLTIAICGLDYQQPDQRLALNFFYLLLAFLYKVIRYSIGLLLVKLFLMGEGKTFLISVSDQSLNFTFKNHHFPI